MAFVTTHTAGDATVYTDEWPGYKALPDFGRAHDTVIHRPGQRVWAIDRDGDGLREVHNNTLEGLWAALRTFLRPFRGVSKWFLHPYVAVFQWGHNLKTATTEFLRTLLGIAPATDLPP